MRSALCLREGDEIVYVTEKDRVILTKAQRRRADDPFLSFGEWDRPADRKAYGKL